MHVHAMKANEERIIVSLTTCAALKIQRLKPTKNRNNAMVRFSMLSSVVNLVM